MLLTDQQPLFLSSLSDPWPYALGPAYRVERELGGGGMSHVFLADDVALGRRVVIKLLPPELAAGVSAERFRREIQLAAQLQHPGIVPLLTAGADGDLLWYVMPYVEGESRRTRLPATSRPRGDRRQRGGGTCRVHWPLCRGGALRRSRVRLLWPPATDAPHSSTSGRLMSAAARHAQGCDSPVRSISSANPTR